MSVCNVVCSKFQVAYSYSIPRVCTMIMQTPSSPILGRTEKDRFTLKIVHNFFTSEGVYQDHIFSIIKQVSGSNQALNNQHFYENHVDSINSYSSLQEKRWIQIRDHNFFFLFSTSFSQLEPFVLVDELMVAWKKAQIPKGVFAFFLYLQSLFEPNMISLILILSSFNEHADQYI